MPSSIIAVREQDCARKLRILYQFPRALSRDFLQLFPEAEVRIQEFSRFSPLAKDHFSLVIEDRILLKGIFGEQLVIAVFWKAKEQNFEQEVAGIESRFQQLGFGAVCYRKQPEACCA